MLFEQGKIGLENAVSKHLDFVSPPGSKMQIRHVLSHTSGLPAEPLENFKGKGYNRYNTEDICNHIIKQELIHPTSE